MKIWLRIYSKKINFQNLLFPIYKKPTLFSSKIIKLKEKNKILYEINQKSQLEPKDQ